MKTRRIFISQLSEDEYGTMREKNVEYLQFANSLVSLQSVTRKVDWRKKISRVAFRCEIRNTRRFRYATLLTRPRESQHTTYIYLLANRTLLIVIKHLDSKKGRKWEINIHWHIKDTR